MIRVTDHFDWLVASNLHITFAIGMARPNARWKLARMPQVTPCAVLPFLAFPWRVIAWFCWEMRRKCKPRAAMGHSCVFLAVLWIGYFMRELAGATRAGTERWEFGNNMHVPAGCWNCHLVPSTAASRPTFITGAGDPRPHCGCIVGGAAQPSQTAVDDRRRRR